MTTRSAIIVNKNRFLRLAQASQIQDEILKMLISAARVTSEFFKISSTENIKIPNPTEFKKLPQESLTTSSVLFGNSYMETLLMPIMLLKDIGEIYGFGSPESPFVQALGLGTTESASYQPKAIVWFTWMKKYSAQFTHIFLDR